MGEFIKKGGHWSPEQRAKMEVVIAKRKAAKASPAPLDTSQAEQSAVNQNAFLDGINKLVKQLDIEEHGNERSARMCEAHRNAQESEAAPVRTPLECCYSCIRYWMYPDCHNGVKFRCPEWDEAYEFTSSDCATTVWLDNERSARMCEAHRTKTEE